MATGGEDMILAIKETLRYGLFLGTYAGTFVSVDELIAAVGGHHRQLSLSWFYLFRCVEDLSFSQFCDDTVGYSMDSQTFIIAKLVCRSYNKISLSWFNGTWLGH